MILQNRLGQELYKEITCSYTEINKLKTWAGYPLQNRIIRILKKMKIEFEDLVPETAIVEHNVGMLNRDMQDLLSLESIGGNAGTVEIAGKTYPCGAANGYANRETGEIVIFNNVQDVPEEIVESNAEFTLRVALDFAGGKFIKIVDFFGSNNFSVKGRLAIEAAISKWNAEDGHYLANYRPSI